MSSNFQICKNTLPIFFWLNFNLIIMWYKLLVYMDLVFEMYWSFLNCLILRSIVNASCELRGKGDFWFSFAKFCIYSLLCYPYFLCFLFFLLTAYLTYQKSRVCVESYSCDFRFIASSLEFCHFWLHTFWGYLIRCVLFYITTSSWWVQFFIIIVSFFSSG